MELTPEPENSPPEEHTPIDSDERPGSQDLVDTIYQQSELVESLTHSWRNLLFRPGAGSSLVLDRNLAGSGQVYLYGPEPLVEVTGGAVLIAGEDAQVTTVTNGTVIASGRAQVHTVRAGGEVQARDQVQVHTVSGGQVVAGDQVQVHAVAGGQVVVGDQVQVHAVAGGQVVVGDQVQVHAVSGGRVWAVGQAQVHLGPGQVRVTDSRVLLDGQLRVTGWDNAPLPEDAPLSDKVQVFDAGGNQVWPVA